MSRLPADRKSGFDWITPVYDRLRGLVFGDGLQQAQAIHLPQVPAGASVLLLGGGTGWLLEQVLTRCQPARVVYLETSGRMLAKASRRVLSIAGAAPVVFRLGDESALQSEERFDVIITPFVLDLYTSQTLVKQMLPRLLRVLKPDGQWLVTDFINTNVWWQKALIWAMIRFFNITAGIEARYLANWQQLLAQAGLVRQHQQRAVWGMVSSEVWRTVR